MPFVERRDPALNVPLRLWTDVAEEGALEQARHVACLPFVVHWMPDVHVGYGVPVGCAFAARDTVVPAAVGFDIACGMVAVRTNLPAKALAARLDRALGLIQRAVPTGFHGHSRPQDDPVFDTLPDKTVVRELEETARLQLGSLGGGNHFLPVCTLPCRSAGTALTFRIGLKRPSRQDPRPLLRGTSRARDRVHHRSDQRKAGDARKGPGRTGL